MKIDSEHLEDWLDDRGYNNASTISDLNDRIEQLESMVQILCKRVVISETVLQYAIQGRIGGYEQEKGKRMELYITGEPVEPKPTMFERIEEIINQEVDTDQPWLN